MADGAPTPAQTGPSFVVRVGGVLATPRRAFEHIDAHGGGLSAALWLLLIGTVCARFADLTAAMLAFTHLPPTAALQQLLAVAGQEAREALVVFLPAALILYVAAGSGRRDANRDFELAAACVIPGVAVRALYRACAAVGWESALAYRASWLVTLLWSLFVLIIAVDVARRRPLAAPSTPASLSGAGRASVVVLAGLLGVSFFAQSRSAADSLQRFQPVGPGATAPDFSLPRVGAAAAPVTLSGLRGKVVLLDFWATWCPPCVKMAPDLHALYAEWSPRGVEFVGVSEDGPAAADAVAAFVTEHAVKYPVVLDDGSAGDRYAVRMLPRLFVIGRDGKIVRVFAGGTSRGEIAAALTDAVR